MQEKHTLGVRKVRAGEILTFTYDDPIPNKSKHVTVVALEDIDLSREMALFCEQTDRSGKNIYTENALPAFVEYLAEKRLLHVGNEVVVHFGEQHRPASRLMNEYRFRLNPESYWEDKLVNRYTTSSFTVFNHQQHTLVILKDVDAPFRIAANIVDMNGEPLGILRLSALPDHRHTVINDDDIERIRLALQSDITMHVPEICVMVEQVNVTSNPDFGRNEFKRHFPTVIPNLTKPETVD